MVLDITVRSGEDEYGPARGQSVNSPAVRDATYGQ